MFTFTFLFVGGSAIVFDVFSNLILAIELIYISADQ